MVGAGPVRDVEGSVGVRRSLGRDGGWRSMGSGMVLTDGTLPVFRKSDWLLQKRVAAITHREQCTCLCPE